ncbi:MAG: MFS transporter [Candidatus Thorarchaeota archaeon]|nr:MFS transporter [Candidatus Thorarchaeota archaeon]
MNHDESRIARQMLLLCSLGALAIFSSTMSKSPVLPYFASYLGAGDETLGMIGAASPATGILVSAPVGVLMDRKGPKVLLWAAAFLFAFVPFLYFFVTVPIHLVIVRFIHGFATAILGPVALAIVAEWYGNSRGEKMALYSSSTRVGRTVAPLVGGFLLAVPVFQQFGVDIYRGVYLLCGFIGLTVLAIAIVLPINPTKKEQIDRATAPDIPVSAVLTKDVLIICAAQAATFFLYGAYEFFFPLFWTEVSGAPEWFAGPAFTLLTMTLLISGPIVGRASDRFGRVPFIGTGLVSLCMLIILATLIPNIWFQFSLIVPIALSIVATDSTTSPLVTESVATTQKGNGPWSAQYDHGCGAFYWTTYHRDLACLWWAQLCLCFHSRRIVPPCCSPLCAVPFSKSGTVRNAGHR